MIGISRGAISPAAFFTSAAFGSDHCINTFYRVSHILSFCQVYELVLSDDLQLMLMMFCVAGVAFDCQVVRCHQLLFHQCHAQQLLLRCSFPLAPHCFSHPRNLSCTLTCCGTRTLPQVSLRVVSCCEGPRPESLCTACHVPAIISCTLTCCGTSTLPLAHSVACCLSS